MSIHDPPDPSGLPLGRIAELIADAVIIIVTVILTGRKTE